jgi:deoxycytidylate deaminase
MPAPEYFFHQAAQEAKKALCTRALCGAVVVQHGTVIGRGYNAPPQDAHSACMCDEELVTSPKQKSDRTCCVHAEWRALFDAVRTVGDLTGSELFFTRVDTEGNILKSGVPYCTVCSRLALDLNLARFWLWHEDGVRAYPTNKYNMLSYQFHRGT